MKRYKSFGQTGISQSSSNPKYDAPSSNHTPMYALPTADVPQQIQQQEYQREESGYNVNRAIRNFARQPQYQQPQPYPQQPQPYPQQQYQQPQPYPQQLPLPLPSYPLPTYSHETPVKLCSKISKHLKNCSSCAKKYTNADVNMYISIIVGLILFIMFLLTKIIDKFG